MNFKNNIWTLKPPDGFSINLPEDFFSSSRDIYFRAKQRELLSQYQGARLLLNETEVEKVERWYRKVKNEQFKIECNLEYKAYFYESALMYYNVVVDLSWAICYLSIEYVIIEKNKKIEFGGFVPIEEAYELMRKAEDKVVNPTAKGNPYGYLEKMCPEFADAIDMVCNFWEKFGPSEIRKKYNYCKHKGKPKYDELVAFQPRIFNLYSINENGTRSQLPSAVRDV
jgi:hypothetical protein